MNNYQRLTTQVKFICLLLILSFPLRSQKLLYAKDIGNSFPVGGDMSITSSCIDKSGYTYMFGTFESTADFDPGPGRADLTSAGLFDMFIAKYDASGKYVYAKRIGSKYSDKSGALTTDGLGNVFITGSISDTIDFDPGPGIHNLIPLGGADMFLAKYDATGNLVYAKSIGGLNNENADLIKIDSSANLYITGTFDGTTDFDPGAGVANMVAVKSGDKTDAFIAKYDRNGNYVYAKAISGTGYEKITDLEIDDSANIYITGSFAGHTDFDLGAGVVRKTATASLEIFIAKYNKACELKFVSVLRNESVAFGGTLTLDHLGNFYVTGRFHATMDFDPGPGIANVITTRDAFFIAKYDISGNYKFAKALASSGYLTGDISIEPTGNVTVFGSFNGTADFNPGPDSAMRKSKYYSDVFMARYDTLMNLIYVKIMEGFSFDANYMYAVGFDGSGNMRVAGSFIGSVDFDPGIDIVNLSTVSPASHIRNIYIGLYKNDGSYVRVGQIGNYSAQVFNETGKSITVDHAGNTYMTGSFSGSVDFDSGPGIANIASVGDDDAFIAKYDRNGNYLWAIGFGSTSPETGKSIAVDDLGNVYVMGSFSKTVDFDPGPGIATRKSKGWEDIFFAKYDSDGHYIYAKSIGAASSDEVGYDMTVDGEGNLYLTGIIIGIHDFDLDEAVFNLGSDEIGANIFFAKYNPMGKLVYAKELEDAKGDALGIAVDRKGNIYMTGYFEGTVDFNPGVAVANLVSIGTSCIFIASYDPGGNYRYARAMDSKDNIRSNYYHAGHDIAVDDTGNIYITGSIDNTTDFDPGPAVANLVCNKDLTMFFAKYDPAGNYIYAKGIAGGYFNLATSLAITNSGYVYITGNFGDTVDMDPGPGRAMHRSVSSADCFIAKYDPEGNYVYSKAIDTKGYQYRSYITTDYSGDLYLTGCIKNAVNFGSASASGNTSIIAENGADIFFAKYTDSLRINPVIFSVNYVDNERQTLIKWSTGSQSNITSFEVERSQDSIHFESIHKRSGCTNCTTGTNYEFYDTKPYTGKSFYRLKITEDTYNISYSKILSINVKEILISTLYVFPVVTNDAFQIFINNKNLRRQVVIQLASAYGNVISEQTVWLNEGDNKFNYSLANMQSGLYYVKMVGREADTPVPVWVIKK